MQVADLLREQIAAGLWREWLPGERRLTETLQVSRKTLRKALAHLRREGLLKATHGVGNRVATPSRPKTRFKPRMPVVMLLTPEPLERMRPHTSLWVNHLKTLLIENEARLEPIDGRKFFSHRPAKALEKLIRQHPADCWLLANSSEASQAWFSTQSMPCVIAGSSHPGIDLPNIDLDHYAICYHAAGRLLAAGHRRIALLNERSGRAGDLESEGGFLTGIRRSPHADAVPIVVNHEHASAHLCQSLGRLLGEKHPPTALLVSDAVGYLTVISYLAQRQLRVPQDISVVLRDDDPFLSFLVPAPSRYACSPNAYAKKILKPLLQLLRGEPASPRSARIFPAYIKGETLSSPRVSVSAS